MLLTTHQLDEAEQLCDRIAIVDHGRVIATGAPRELVARSGTQQTVTLRTVTALDRARLGQLPGVTEIGGEGAAVSFRTNDATATLAALTRWLQETRAEIVELDVRKASLEDVFLRLTRADEKKTE